MERRLANIRPSSIVLLVRVRPSSSLFGERQCFRTLTFSTVWKLKAWDTLWLSETPKVPSKGWDAASTRIATVGQFVHHTSGQLIIVVSTHLDDQGAKSRKESAKLILSVLEFEAGFARADAVLLAGDFNSPPNDEAYRVVTAPDSGMVDVNDMVPTEKRYGNEITFTGFCHESAPKRIDFIFSRKTDKLLYGSYAVLPNRFDDAVYSSDHRACVADLQLLRG
jgi:endonuclease/exonuclease/phosphatase family metal-dependent hydrolase